MKKSGLQEWNVVANTFNKKSVAATGRFSNYEVKGKQNKPST